MVSIFIITHSYSIHIVSDIPCSTLLSDHFAIIFNLNCSKPKPIRKIINYRRLSNIHIPTFISDFNDLLSVSSVSTSLYISYIDLVNESLHLNINTHAPLKSLSIIDRPHNKWYNEEITDHKRRTS